MNKPVFSIVASAIKKQFYDGFYKSVSKGNTIPFEIIFVGDNEPIKIMPDNFHYIYTKVKPAQCLEIAARQAKGEYLIPIADDVLFSEEFLNNMHKHIMEHGGEKVIVAPKFSQGGVDKGHCLYFDKETKLEPIFRICPALRRDVWHKIGGIDNRFIGNFLDYDLVLRFFENGYRYVDAFDCNVDERIPKKGSINLYKKIGKKDAKNLLNSLWLKNGIVSRKRLLIVQSFADKDILIKSQGNNLPLHWE